MTNLAFLDTETTSLRPDRRAWEIGLILREPGQPDVEHHWFVDVADLDLGNADLTSLRIGRFYERHPGDLDVSAEWDALAEVEALVRGAHIVGAVPNFDTEVLAARMRENNLCPSWHYHLIDVEALMVGYLAGLRARGAGENGRDADLPSLPWRSDDLSRACGVEPDEDARHTALGDARWARDIYDAVTGTREG